MVIGIALGVIGVWKGMKCGLQAVWKGDCVDPQFGRGIVMIRTLEEGL